MTVEYLKRRIFKAKLLAGEVGGNIGVGEGAKGEGGGRQGCAVGSRTLSPLPGRPPALLPTCSFSTPRASCCESAAAAAAGFRTCRLPWAWAPSAAAATPPHPPPMLRWREAAAGGRGRRQGGAKCSWPTWATRRRGPTDSSSPALRRWVRTPGVRPLGVRMAPLAASPPRWHDQRFLPTPPLPPLTHSAAPLLRLWQTTDREQQASMMEGLAARGPGPAWHSSTARRRTDTTAAAAAGRPGQGQSAEARGARVHYQALLQPRQAADAAAVDGSATRGDAPAGAGTVSACVHCVAGGGRGCAARAEL